MINIPDYFYDLFTSDATIGLDPYGENLEFRSRMDGEDYVLTVTDTSEEFFDAVAGDYVTENAPVYEIRVTRIR